MSNSTEVRPVVAALIHADGRTDVRTGMKKLTGDLRYYARAPKNSPRPILMKQYLLTL
jgi:hypothetical protein